jgi:hypothetical protein
MVFKKSVAVLVIAGLTSGCASILSKSDWPVSIQSTPSGIPFSIRNKEGQEISGGTTPQTITLKSGAGYFSSQKYTVTFNRNGVTTTREISADINGWYIANILFGGLIGLLIVDPITGAMYKLPESVVANIEQVKTSDNEKYKLIVLSMNELTPLQRAQLEPIQ